MPTRYVNTGSAGGNGTTSALSGANAAYASLDACESGEDQNDLSEPMVINCAGTAADTNAVSFSGWTGNSATNTITVNGDYDVKSGVHYSTSYYRLEVTVGQPLTTTEAYVYFNKIQVKVTASSGSSLNCIYFNQCFGGVDRCITYSDLSGTAAGGGIVLYGVTSSDTLTVNNCIAYGNGLGDGIRVFVNGTLIANNCTVSGYANGLRRSAGTFNAVNCAVFNNTDDLNGTVGITYCAGDDADFDSGTGNIGLGNDAAAWNAEFVAYSSFDFHLKQASQLKNAASDLSATFTVDLDGDTRSRWDIGADEFTIRVSATSVGKAPVSTAAGTITAEATGATATATSVVKAPTTTATARKTKSATATSIVKAPTSSGVSRKTKRSVTVSIVKAPTSSGVSRKTKRSVTVSIVKAPSVAATGTVTTVGAFNGTATSIVKAPKSIAICHVHRSATGSSIVKAPLTTATLRRGKRCTAISVVKAPTSVATAVISAPSAFNAVVSSVVKVPRSYAIGRLTRSCTASSIVKAPSVTMTGTAGATGTQIDRIEQLIYVLMAIKS